MHVFFGKKTKLKYLELVGLKESSYTEHLALDFCGLWVFIALWYEAFNFTTNEPS